MKRYSHANWNQVLDSPSCAGREADIKLIGSMAVGNLMWFVRRMIALDKDVEWFKAHTRDVEFVEPTQFTKRRRKMENEDLIRKD